MGIIPARDNIGIISSLFFFFDRICQENIVEIKKKGYIRDKKHIYSKILSKLYEQKGKKRK